MTKFEEAVATLLKNGCDKESNLVIKSSKVSVGEEYTMINVTLKDKKIARYLPKDDDDETYELSEAYTVPILLSSFIRAMREHDTLCRIASHVDAHPQCLEALLPGMKIDIVLQEVKAHATYPDPFSEKSPEKENDEDYDRLFYHVSSLTHCKESEKIAEKILDKMLGF